MHGLIVLSDLARAMGLSQAAVEELQQALALCRKIRAPLYEVRVLARLAAAYVATGDCLAAQEAGQEALVLADGMDSVLIEQIRTATLT